MDRHSDTNRRIMTEKEFNELVLELEKQGYKKTTSTPYGNEDFHYYKSFGESDYDMGRHNYVVLFLLYDWRRFSPSILEAFGVDVRVVVSRVPDEHIVFSIPLCEQTLEDIEQKAQSFFEWCEKNVKLKTK
jgi:hypothetical protein